eukprot:m.163918 g.163918  ORF g.163918 m.163918 type:complete len:516 (+) comp12357_c0_seq1:152-1699(+)
MKLDVELLRYLGGDEFRVLHAVEVGMRNHEYVPVRMLGTIAGLRRGGAHKVLKELVRHKLLGYNNRKCEGYRLTTSGYDFLALRALAARESIASVGNQIGVGKESDIYIVANSEEEQLAMKLHRLGRSSFRTIKKNRDYHHGRKHVSWLYLASLAAKKEFAYMKVLYDHGFPVPRPVDSNRCAIIMELLDATPLHIVKKMEQPGDVYAQLMEIIVRLANYGLVHGDFNEFNLLITRTGKVTLIDFPQMVSTDHENAQFYFDRDVECIRTFFARRFDFEGKNYPRFQEVVRTHTLDVEVAASGFDKTQEQEFNALQAEMEALARAGDHAQGSVSDENSADSDSEEDVRDEEEPAAAATIDLRVKDSHEIPSETDVITLGRGEQEAAPSCVQKLVALSFSDLQDDELVHASPVDEPGLDLDHHEDEEGSEEDDTLEDLQTGNREIRAFRDPQRQATGEIDPKPSLDATAIREKVRRSITSQQKAQSHSRSKKKGGKGQVARGEKKDRKGKSATKIDW